jgi:hypothetical protein
LLRGLVGGYLEAEAREFALLQAVVDEEADADGQGNEAGSRNGEYFADLKNRGQYKAEDDDAGADRDQNDAGAAGIAEAAQGVLGPGSFFRSSLVGFKSRSICSAVMPRCTMAMRCSALMRRAWAWPTIPETMATIATKNAPSGTMNGPQNASHNDFLPFLPALDWRGCAEFQAAA